MKCLRIPAVALRLSLIGVLALIAFTGGLPDTAKAAEQGKPSADSTETRRELLMRNLLSQPFENDGTMIRAVPFALAAYWLNERQPEADAAVIRAASPEMPGVGTAKDEQGKNHYYRQAYLLQRVYFLFNSRSEYFPGRMSKVAEDAVAATTFYRPSPLVDDLVRAGTARGTYAYVSRRLGKGATAGQVGKPEEVAPDSRTSDDAKMVSAHAEALAPNGGNLLRYTFCTPDFVMGTSMVPALPLNEWTAISSQNRWEGVIFAGHPTARIFPQPEATDGSHFYNGSWSVQNKGLMIVQRLRTIKGAKGQRVWFDASLKRQERSGWVFAEAPQAYAAVRVVDGGSRWEPDEAKKGKPASGIWLKCENDYTPVIIDTAPKSDYPTYAAFQDAILKNPLDRKDGRLDYQSGHYRTNLTLHTDYSKAPEVDGVPINYSPAKCYDSPFLQGDWGSGVVTLQNGERKLLLDFNKDQPSPCHSPKETFLDSDGNEGPD